MEIEGLRESTKDAVIARLMEENKRLREVLEELLSCPMAVDQATVPMAGIESAPHQVVLNMSISLLRLQKAKQALEGGRE